MVKKILVVLLVLTSIFILASCKKECEHESISFTQTIKKPTCLSVGKEQYVCDDCGEYFTYDIEKLEHIEDTGTLTTPATCYQEGQMTYSCAREDCHEILRVEKIDIIPHEEGKGTVTTEPTCTSEGEMSYFCTNEGCNVVLRTEVIEMLPHTEGDWKVIKEETCSEDGYKSLLCAHCDYEFKGESIPAHHVEEILNKKDSTCSETGLTEGVKCSVCDEILVAQETIPLKPHSMIKVPKVEPTCTSYGYTEGERCSKCDYWSIKQKEISMLDHQKVTDKAVSATCTSTGLTEGSHCSVCNTILVKQTTVSALGHNFDFYTNACKRCSIKEYKEIRSRNDLLAFAGNTAYDAVIYLDYCINVSATNEYWTLTIGPQTKYIKFIGTAGVEYNLRFIINGSRTSTLKVDLVNTTLKYLDASTIESTAKTKLELGLYGTRSAIIGSNGSNGANASLGSSYNGRNATNGFDAIKLSGDLVINVGASYSKISGGNGGNGGKGLDAAPSPQDGGKGGNGGNGGRAIVANSITVNGVNGCSSKSIIITGGAGGSGGSGGAGFLWGKKGSNGSNGSSGAASSTAITYK